MSAGNKLKVAPAAFVPRPEAQTDAALLALRTLFRDHLDTRGLDSSARRSVDYGANDEEVE